MVIIHKMAPLTIFQGESKQQVCLHMFTHQANKFGQNKSKEQNVTKIT